MADEEGRSDQVNTQTPGIVWKRKYLTLEKRCKQIEQENERDVNRLYHVRKLLRRYRRERKFLMEKLDEHGDDFRNAKSPLQSQLMAEIVSESLPTSFLSYGLEGPESPGHSSNATTSSQKKGKSRSAAKQEKEKDPNAPKKPANAFFMFCQQQRTIMQEDQKDATTAMGHHELTKTLAKEWNNLLQDEKKIYYEMYEKDKERYEQEMKKYSLDKAFTKKEKDPSTKKHKAKTAKAKDGIQTAASASNTTSVDSCSDPRSGLVVSPTLNPLFPQSLTSVPFGIPLIPSPTLPPTDKTAFQDFEQLSPPSQDSFLSG